MKILLLCEAQLGDLLLLTPSLRALKQSIPGARITVLIMHRRRYSGNEVFEAKILDSKFEGTSQALLNNPDVDEILELDRNALRSLQGLKRIKAELKCINQIKRKKFDAVICTFPQSRFIIWSFLAGIKTRVGQKDQSFSWLLTKKPDVNALKYNVLMYYYKLVEALGAHSDSFKTVYNVSEEEINGAKRMLKKNGLDASRKLLFIHPGASGKYRIWPPKFFAAVADYVSENKLAQVIICGSPFDKEAVDEVTSNSLKKHKVLVFNSIRSLGGVISLSTCCLLNNSGPRHLAAALGIKNVAVFEKYDNGQWKIYDEENNAVIESGVNCKYCRDGHCGNIITANSKFGSECLHQVSVQKVIDKIKDIL